MACNSISSCGPDIEQLKLLIKSIIFDMLNDNTLQAGLKDCGEDWLGKGRHVVVCEALADLICDLINDGKLCVPKIAGFTSDCDAKTLTITMADGTELTADASCFGGAGADGNTKIKSFTYDPQTGIANITDTEDREFEVTISTKNTTNREMGWNPDTQEVSVTDTDNNTVKTPVVFGTVEKPPVNRGATPAGFIGKSGEIFLGEPAMWIRMLLPNGQVGKLPVFLEDAVGGCIPYQELHPETGDPIPLTIVANAFKFGDTLETVAARNAALKQKHIAYSPGSATPDMWKEFATYIIDWLEQNEGPGINPGDYVVYIPRVGDVKLHYLRDIETFGAFGTIKYYHAYGADLPLGTFAQGVEGESGVSSDGKIYLPAKPECGFGLEPILEDAVHPWVSLTYANVTGGFASEILESDQVFISDVPVELYKNHDKLWSEIFKKADKLRQDLGLTWIINTLPGENEPGGNDRPYVVAINTSFGSIDMYGTFDFSQYDSASHTESQFVKEAIATKGTRGDPATATLIPFYKQDEVTVEDVTSGPGQSKKRVVFANAKKNILHLYVPARGGTLLNHFNTAHVDEAYRLYFHR